MDLPKVKLAIESEAQIDRLLKILAIIYLAQQIDREDMGEKVTKAYGPVLEVLAGNLDELVREYQERYGEI